MKRASVELPPVSFHALRYVQAARIRDRKHIDVDRRFASWAEAEDARIASPRPELLEVVEREVPAPKVMTE